MTNTLNKVIHNGDEYEIPGIPNDTTGTTSIVSNIWAGTSSEYSLITPKEGQLSIVLHEEGGGGGWQPGANTLLYLPLNSTYTYTDQSGNQVSTTNTNVTFGTYQGVDCGTFSNNTRIIVSPFNIPNDFTFVGRCYNTGVYQFEGQIFDARDGSNYIRSVFWIASEYYGYYGSLDEGNTYDTSGVNFIQNQWVLCAFVATNGKQELYVKGNNIDNYQSTTYQYSGFTPTNISIGQEWNNGANRHFKGGLSNIIIEDKTWTAQEVANYYDQTKADYGIS